MNTDPLPEIPLAESDCPVHSGSYIMATRTAPDGRTVKVGFPVDSQGQGARYIKLTRPCNNGTATAVTQLGLTPDAASCLVNMLLEAFDLEEQYRLKQTAKPNSDEPAPTDRSAS